MLPSRLQRTLVELQSHRIWLSTFIDTRNVSSTRSEVGHTTSRFFSATRNRDREIEIESNDVLKASFRQTKQNIRKAGGSRITNEALPWEVRDLVQAIEDYNIDRVIALYGDLPEKNLLRPEEAQALAQCGLESLRREKFKEVTNRESISRIVAFGTQLSKDIQAGRLSTNAATHVRLLALFENSGHRDSGIKFWHWLENQGDLFVNPEVYAIAIDLLSQTGTPLNELEELYHNALTRFPGTFHAYHLSTGAILPDRKKAVEIRRLPMSLLRSIIHARLLRGDWRQAYLGLDTAFRLFPSVPPRLLKHFQDERPISESYTVFAMACRAGVIIPNNQFKGLLIKLRTASEPPTVQRHFAWLRTTLAATYLHLGTWGQMKSHTVNELVIAVSQIFRIPGVTNLEKKERQLIVEATLVALRSMIAIFARYRAVPTSAAFNAIISNVAGYGRTKDVLGIAISDMTALGIEIDYGVIRNQLIAAGILKDLGLVQKYWKDLVQMRQLAGEPPSSSELHLLMIAARRVGGESFADAQVKLYKHHLNENQTASLQSLRDRPQEILDHELTRPPPDSQPILDGINHLIADLAYIDKHTEGTPVIQDFSNQTVPLTLFPPDSVLAIPETDMRTIYDDFTTDPSTAEPPAFVGDASSSSTAPSLAPTNVSFANLRYENWKCINYLLRLAETHEEAHGKAVDRAIAAAETPPRRMLGLTDEEVERMGGFGLARGGGGEAGSADAEGLDRAWEEIARLRGRGT